MKSKKLSLRPNPGVWLIVILAFFLLGYKLDKPFYGHHDWNGVFFGNVARNTARLGFLRTKFGALRSFLPADEGDFSFYTHYPPVFHLLLGLEASLFGVKEWLMRLLSIAFSLLAVYLIYKIGQIIFNQRTALLGGLFLVLTPMFLYFAKMPIHEVYGLPLVAFSFYRYFLFCQAKEEEDKKKAFKYLLIALIFAHQTVWSAYYLTPLFIFHHWLLIKKKDRRLFLLLLVPLFSFLSHLIHTFILTSSWSNNLFATMFFRMQIGRRAAKFQFGLIEYLKKETLWLTVYFTRMVCLLAFFYLLVLVGRLVRDQIRPKDGYLLLLVIFPFIDPIIFRNVCFIHDYKLYYFLLSLPLLASAGLLFLEEKLNFLWRGKRLISLAGLVIIFIIFSTERLEFTKTLLHSEMNKPAHDLGLILQKEAKKGEVVLLGSPSFGQFLDLFLNFYGERKVVYFEPKLENFLEVNSSRVGLVVFPAGREEPEPALMNFLENNYSSFEKGDFLFFDLGEKK